MSRFLALDVETANADLSSICQIGIVEFRDNEVVSKWGTLVNPQTYFDAYNIEIHGITDDMVAAAPTFVAIHPVIQAKVKDAIVVTHTHFDITSLSQACEIDNLPEISCAWLDSARVVRRQWSEFRQSGYGLSSIAEYLDIQYKAHDAVDDARAAGLVIIEAMRQSNQTLEEWLIRAYKNIPPSSSLKKPDPDGHLYGEAIVFTGALSMPRREAAELAAQAGCNVSDRVTKKTTLLVIGIQDIDKLAGYDKSSKHRKAESMAKEGAPLRIITEKDFLKLLNVKQKTTRKRATTSKSMPWNASFFGEPEMLSISKKLFRSIETPIREYTDMQHRWHSDDQGLIWCWERGRQIAQENPALAARAKAGELVMLQWKGGVPAGYKGATKKGTLQYLAQWQGLREKDLNIDISPLPTLTCSSSGVKVVFSNIAATDDAPLIDKTTNTP